MFNNIYFWINKNKNKSDHFHEGTYWMYCTVREFTEKYPFWTTSKIRRIMKNLIEKKYIDTGVFNRFGYDKTKWYTITQKGLDIVNNSKETVEIENRYVPF